MRRTTFGLSRNCSMLGFEFYCLQAHNTQIRHRITVVERRKMAAPSFCTLTENLYATNRAIAVNIRLVSSYRLSLCQGTALIRADHQLRSSRLISHLHYENKERSEEGKEQG